MAEGSDEERKHAPTERRLRQAAERGDVLRSVDLPRAATIILVVTAALNLAAVVGGDIRLVVQTALTQAGSGNLTLARGWAIAVMSHLFPILGLIAGLSILVGGLFGGWTFSVAALMPKFEKILSFAGLGELFAASGLTETAKSLIKFVAIGAIAAVSLQSEQVAFVSLAAYRQGVGQAVIATSLHVLTNVAVVLAFIAAADLALQIWLFRRRHRMSDQELRDEMKEAVGNPHIKQRQRAAARRIARSRQMRRLPEASVVVTNPTHIAVALRFRRGQDAVPVLLAKGADLLALEILSKARSYGIPIVEAPPLARAVYRYVEPDEHIPVALYRACAEVLAYVWRLQQWRAQRGEGEKPRPPRLSDIDMAKAAEDAASSAGSAAA
ncbi:EscU/YscU/HrcU family type III secretion system export apparatus switch protein [Acidisoma sp. 7E03]